MAFPPAFLDELKSRVSLAQVVGRRVTWDRAKSNQGRGDWWAPCPFHHEKTASFHVLDRQGYFKCFGCQEAGSLFDFVMKIDGLSFPEAVESLAREAGMEMPARDAGEKRRADRKSQLAEVMEQALRHYRLLLSSQAGAEARDYPERRGLDRDAQARWEIGFAPPGWQTIGDHLKGQGVAPDLTLACGLTRASDKGREPYDVFRHRILFPIRDARGVLVGFGGRAMDPDDNAKYLNSQATELFDKSRTLWNVKRAREAVARGAPLILAEGYMDVIALSEAGMGGAVAPLGTAVTDEQLDLLWRIAEEPVVALDGDRAGLAAGMKLIDKALPKIGPDRTLRFALLPEGQDPDDLIRAEGADAMRARIETAAPLIDLLWRRETEARAIDTPERRAALDQALKRAIREIGDPQVRHHYAQAIGERRRALYAPAEREAPRRLGADRASGRRGRDGRAGRDPQGAPAGGPTPSAAASRLVTAGPGVEAEMREAVILATLARHPSLALDFEEHLDRLEPATEAHAALREALLRHAAGDPVQIASAHLEKVVRLSHVRLAPGVRSEDREIARTCLEEEFAKHAARRGAEAEITEALRDVADSEDESLTYRLGRAAEALWSPRGGLAEKAADYEVGDNGARVDRDERQAFRALIDRIAYEKPKKRRD